MNEEDVINKLFQRADLKYGFEDFEEAVLQKIKIRDKYRRRKQVYALVGKLGFGCFIILCFLYVLIVGGTEFPKIGTAIYLLLGIPFLLVLLILQLEALVGAETNKKST